jgi:phosphorylcholine metabolism protein LicD
MSNTYSYCHKTITTIKIIKIKEKFIKKYSQQSLCQGRIIIVEDKYLICKKCGRVDLISNIYPPFENRKIRINALYKKILLLFHMRKLWIN